MQIVVVRHAQPDWEPGGFAVDNPSLTPLGLAQAECVATALSAETFDAIYVSPLIRTVQTAAPLLRLAGLQSQKLSWLREMGMPVLEGQSQEQIQQYFTKVRSRELDQWWEGMPGGEPFDDFYQRVSTGLETLLTKKHALAVERHDDQRIWRVPKRDQRILFFAHEGTNAALIAHLLGTPPRPWLHLQLSSNWAGISRLHSTRMGSAHVWSLESFNRIEHLESLAAQQDGRTSTL